MWKIPYKLKPNQYFKLAKADGWDGHTGKTINYRESIGKVVKVPGKPTSPVGLCSPSVIHATKDALYWLSNVGLPCSLFVVEGKPVVQDSEKAGFSEFKVLKEIPARHFDKLLGFKYSEAINPFDPRKILPPPIDDKILGLLKTWDSVRGSVWDSVRDSVWDSEAAYIGTLFPSVKQWKYVKYEPGVYPFQPAVDLIKLGIIPAYDSYHKEWYLCHPKKDANAEILWKGTLEEAGGV